MNTQYDEDIHVRIYNSSEHNIQDNTIDRDVIGIIKRLKRRGFCAYIVGGAIRDLILGVTPKDYDIVTDATPSQVRRVFSNCRIIGKRFRLIHVYFGTHKIIEVATFRSGRNVNAYGRIEEDVWRRDFTSNALYYDVITDYLIDYVGGYRDICAGKLVPVIPIDVIFSEDPVRIIRALKYSSRGGLTIVRPLMHAIRRDAHLIKGVSSSRLTEECIKILSSGHAREIFTNLHSCAILQFLQPNLEILMQKRRNIPRINAILQKLDAHTNYDAQLGSVLSMYFPLFEFDFYDTDSKQRMRMAKKAIRPITPPNSVVAHAVEHCYNEYRSKKKRMRKRRY